MKTIAYSSRNPYLHKDFHGALCYAIHYLDSTFGPDATVEYLQQVARTCYAPLIDALRQKGLTALEQHLRRIFSAENGQFRLYHENDTLVLEVSQCPAIAHLLKTNQLFTDRFCLTTVIVNRTICQGAGYECSCEYQPRLGRCVQKFWKSKDK